MVQTAHLPFSPLLYPALQALEVVLEFVVGDNLRRSETGEVAFKLLDVISNKIVRYNE